MANATTEWALNLAQKMATLPEQIEAAAAAKDRALAKLAEQDAEISQQALTFPMFEKVDKDGAVKRVCQSSEWQYKVALEHLRAYTYTDELDGDEPMQMANEGYADALQNLNAAVSKYNRLVREWDSIDKILSIFKRAL